MDYCNSLLYDATWVLSLYRKLDWITLVLKQLCWLLVEQRTEFKMLLLTYEALHGRAPAYFSQLLSLYTPNRPLGLWNTHLLTVPRFCLEEFGWFLYATPLLGTISPHLLSMPLLLMPPRTTWRFIYLIWHILLDQPTLNFMRLHCLGPFEFSTANYFECCDFSLYWNWCYIYVYHHQQLHYYLHRHHLHHLHYYLRY